MCANRTVAVVRRTNTHLFGEAARAFWRVENLIVKHGEIQGQSQAYRMGRRHLLARASGGVLVRLQRVFRGFRPRVALLKLGQVSVVVAFHLVVKHL